MEPAQLLFIDEARALDSMVSVFYRSFHRISTVGITRRRNEMGGYIAQRRGRFYAVIYEGDDPVTGKERRTWHPAGTDRAAAERLAARLAAEEQGRADAARSLTFGAYLRGQWLPGKKLQLAAAPTAAPSGEPTTGDERCCTSARERCTGTGALSVQDVRRAVPDEEHRRDK